MSKRGCGRVRNFLSSLFGSYRASSGIPVFPIILIVGVLILLMFSTSFFCRKESESVQIADNVSVKAAANTESGNAEGMDKFRQLRVEVIMNCYELDDDKKDDCFLHNALMLKDAYLCQQMKDVVLADQCVRTTSCYLRKPYHEMLARQCVLQKLEEYDQPFICFALPQDFEVKGCIMDWAKQHNDTSACALFTEQTDRDDCEWGARPVEVREVDCARYAPVYSADACFYNRAVQEGRSILCDSIQDSNIKKKCLNAVSGMMS